MQWDDILEQLEEARSLGIGCVILSETRDTFPETFPEKPTTSSIGGCSQVDIGHD